MKLSAAVGALTPEEVLVRGFEVVPGLPDITEDHYQQNHYISLFKSFFGPSPTTVAFIWQDIVEVEFDLGLDDSDLTEPGFKGFLRALHFLWAYPKNATILAYTTGVKVWKVEGENLWHWVKVISGLKLKVIVWPGEEYNRSDRYILLTVDGVDFRTWEKSTKDFNMDPGTMSHKYKHGALKYEIGVDAYEAKIVWINGPKRGAMGDLTIFREDGGLLEMIPEGKLVVSDRVYSDKKAVGNNEKLALPNLADSEEFFQFKSKLRARHESLNGRLKDFRILDATYHHDPKNHVFVLEAVAVIVQYDMDHGHPIFPAHDGDYCFDSDDEHE